MKARRLEGEYVKDKIVNHLRQWHATQIWELQEAYHDEDVKTAIIELQRDGRVERISGGSATRYVVIEA